MRAWISGVTITSPLWASIIVSALAKVWAQFSPAPRQEQDGEVSFWNRKAAGKAS